MPRPSSRDVKVRASFSTVLRCENRVAAYPGCLRRIVAPPIAWRSADPELSGLTEGTAWVHVAYRVRTDCHAMGGAQTSCVPFFFIVVLCISMSLKVIHQQMYY